MTRIVDCLMAVHFQTSPNKVAFTCFVDLFRFDGNSYFDVQDGCLRHRGCICYCNGTWSCPKERSINTCEGERVVGPARTCKSCNAKGKVVAGETYFDLEEPCKRYRYCRCRCDGSWECPEQYAEDTCKSPTTPSPVNLKFI